MTQSISDRDERNLRALNLLKSGTTDQYEQVNAFTADEYTNPDMAKLERDRVFGRVPSIVAHSSEVAKPRDFLTVKMPRNNILIVRQKDGTVKSFVNLCRHRGSLLEAEESGRARLFSCPYHRWSYDTDGALRAITLDDTFGEIERRKQGLLEIPTEERHGFIWVVDRYGAEIDVRSWLGEELDDTIAGFGIEECVTFRAEGYDEDINWKILQHAFLDSYHIQFAHPNSAARHVHTNVLAVDDFGRHSRWVTPRKTIDRFLEEDPGDADLSPYVIEAYFLLPNSTLLRQPDHFQLLTFRPDRSDPQKGRMEMRVIVPTVEDSGMAEERWKRLWDKNWQILRDVLFGEDMPILRNSQVGMQSEDAAPMVYGKNEYINQMFNRELNSLLEVE